MMVGLRIIMVAAPSALVVSPPIAYDPLSDTEGLLVAFPAGFDAGPDPLEGRQPQTPAFVLVR